MFTKKSISWFFSVSFLLALILTLVRPVDAALNTLTGPVEPEQTSQTFSLLQYKAGGHVLGFDVGKVYLAGMDHALTVEFIGGRRNAPAGVPAATPSKSGSTAVLKQVIYENAWRGVNVIYSSTKAGIVESTYVVQPGASPADIRLKYNTPVELLGNGTLRFDFETGSMTESAPIAFQEIEDRHIPAEVRFTLQDTHVSFAVGAYDPDYPLIIDPTYAWHTFYGSSTYDTGQAITRDGTGNIYVAGKSYATWDGPNSTPPLNGYTGQSDIMVVKLNSAGVYQWHTFYGTWRYGDEGAGITSDSAGNIYVAGFSGGGWSGPNMEWPLNPHSDILPARGYTDIVVVKLNSAGAYQWHTFYGGSSIMDAGHTITSDANGSIYVAGFAGAPWNGPNSTPPLNTHSSFHDIVVVKLNSAGAYQWHTFYGSSTYDESNAITNDGAGNLYLTGYSGATWNGPNSTPPLNAHTGGGSGTTNDYDIVVVKLNSAGAYQWHTFYGSSTEDFGYAVANAGDGNIYVAGTSYASWNGPNSAAPLNAHAGSYDIVVVKLNSAGAYQWHTFYGSSIWDLGQAITSDGAGNLYVAGYSEATWNGPNSAAPLNAHSGSNDIVVIKLNSVGAYQWHSFYGSSNSDAGQAITSDGAGNLYVAGSSYATWNGPNSAAPLNTHSGGDDSDIVVVKLMTIPSAAVLISPNGDIGTNYNPTYTWNKAFDASWYYIYIQGPSGLVHADWYSAATVCGASTCSLANVITLGAGEHKWWIQTWNSVGYGPWSAGMTFSTPTPTPPGVATLTSPSGNIITNNPTYTWNEVSEATWYYIYVQGPSGYIFTNWFRAVDVCGASTCSIATITPGLASGQYRWWIQTWNGTGGYGPWSTGMSFTTTLPGAATLSTPNGATTNNPTYTWNKVSEATWYYIYVQGPSGYVFTQWYSSATVCPTSTCSIVGATPGLASGQYRWWIQTWNNVGYGPWSSGMNFSPP
jgi:hypothetical protein